MEDCRNEINALIAEIDSEWTLEQILQCIKNLTDCGTMKKEYKRIFFVFIIVFGQIFNISEIKIMFVFPFVFCIHNKHLHFFHYTIF